MRTHTKISVLTLLATLLVGGCGPSAKVDVSSAGDNIGKQLMDLDDAYNKGIINREEYDKARKRILDGK